MTNAVEARDETVTLNGLRFHYREWGATDAPPLVLLHGFTGHARSWDSFARAMADHYRVLALDQRGHGETEWAAEYGVTRMVEDVEAFRQALALGRFTLLGLSMGGRNAFTYAALHPEAVERLVIVDIGPQTEASGAARIQAGVRASDVFESPEEAIAIARAANPRPPDADLAHRTRHNLMQRPDGRWTWRYDVALRSGTRPPPPSPEEGWALLTKITCPTLLVRGAESDVLGRPTAERMAREIPDCRLVDVAESGHSIPLDNPPGFLAAVRPFLEAPSQA